MVEVEGVVKEEKENIIKPQKTTGNQYLRNFLNIIFNKEKHRSGNTKKASDYQYNRKEREFLLIYNFPFRGG